MSFKDIFHTQIGIYNSVSLSSATSGLMAIKHLI